MKKVTVPSWLYNRASITATDKWVFLCLLQLKVEPVSGIEYDIDMFAALTDLTPNQARISLRTLEMSNLIRTRISRQRDAHEITHETWAITINAPDDGSEARP